MHRESAVYTRDLFWYLLIHLALCGLLLSFPLYLEISSSLPAAFTSCKIHDFLHLYCPVCGLTRAISSLLEGRLTVSFLCYSPLYYFAAMFIFFDIRAFLCLIKGRRIQLSVAPAAWSLLAVAVTFFLLRNVLLTVFHVDPLCDLIFFWL